jgi:GxxExxY protein
MSKLLFKELTGEIIGAYYEVYNHTSRTYPERVYEHCLMYELRRRRIPCVCQDERRIEYKGQIAGLHRLDLLVDGRVVVENKVAERIKPLHKAQTISYLKAWEKEVGLVFNFGGATPEFERVYLKSQGKRTQIGRIDGWADKQVDEGWIHADLAYDIVGGLYEVHSTLGPGFIHRIYANACHHEMLLHGLASQRLRKMQVRYKEIVAGEISFGHLLVDGVVMVFPVAIQDINDIRIENLKDWMRAQQVELGILTNFSDTSLKPVFLRA